MADAVAVFDAATRVTDSSGNPVSGGSIEFYDAGTTTPKLVYSDANLTVSLGSVVALNSGGYPVTGGSVQTLVYTGTASYKMIVKSAAGATLITHDNVKGAQAATPATTSAIPTTSIVAKSADYTATTSDRGVLFNYTVSGARILTLPSAVTAGNNFRVGARIDIGTSTLAIVAVGGQTISRPQGGSGSLSAALTLTGRGAAVWLVSNGANWFVDTWVPPLMMDGLPVTSIVDNTLSTPPASPTAGARYIVGASPTGAWVGIGTNNIAEAAGDGTWFSYVPATGWIASLANSSGRLLLYNSSAWVQAGTRFSSHDLGTISSGTVTPSPLNGDKQFYTNGGAHTLAAPSSDGRMQVGITNNASAGAITFTGFTVGASVGASLTTTNGHKFIIDITRINGSSHYFVYAQQ